MGVNEFSFESDIFRIFTNLTVLLKCQNEIFKKKKFDEFLNSEDNFLVILEMATNEYSDRFSEIPTIC